MVNQWIEMTEDVFNAGSIHMFEKLYDIRESARV